MNYADFGWALEVLEEEDDEGYPLDNAVARRGWNGPGQYVKLQRPDEHSEMTKPYLYITTVQGDRVPWLASQTDILAEDWYRVAGT